MSTETQTFAEIVSVKKSAEVETKDVKHYLGYASKAAGSIDEGTHSINFVISTDEVDRDNEIITVEAIAKAIKAFAKNPIALACHRPKLDDGMPPAVGSWDTDSFRKFNHHSEMRLHFAVETKLGDQYWQAYSNKHMRAVSIGFLPIKWKDAHDPKYGQIRKITELELLEISPVAIGANANALSKAKQRKADFVQDKIDEAAYDKMMADADWSEIEEEQADIEKILSTKGAEFRENFDRECREYANYLMGCGEGGEAEETDNNKNELLDLIGCKQVDDYCDFAKLVSGV